MGRKKKVLSEDNKRTLESLASHGVPMDIICDSLGMCETTLKKKIREEPDINALYKKARANFKKTLTERLYARANESDTVLIFMAKTQLGMSEKSHITLEGGEKPLKVQTEKVVSIKELGNLPVKTRKQILDAMEKDGVDKVKLDK